ncbi:MAG: nucleotidyltransferase domain-containing protein [Anaerolineae bacterium]|nr:nucleotidyltransferase domain-containing protein [Anaerolineae bacterium]
MRRQEIVFAYAYGSFVEGIPFHDIDVGVYLAEGHKQEDPWIAMELAEALEQAIPRGLIYRAAQSTMKASAIPVDVRILNRAPATFCYHVLRGRLLFSRDEDVRVPWAVRVISHYLDIKPLRHAALKEAMTSWT